MACRSGTKTWTAITSGAARSLADANMATSNIVLTVVNGAREPWRPGTDVLVTAMNGRQKLIVRDFVKMPADGRIRLPNLPVLDNLDDRFTVLVSAKDHADAGFTPVRIQADTTHAL